jgi:hypothetical protein
MTTRTWSWTFYLPFNIYVKNAITITSAPSIRFYDTMQSKGIILALLLLTNLTGTDLVIFTSENLAGDNSTEHEAYDVTLSFLERESGN